MISAFTRTASSKKLTLTTKTVCEYLGILQRKTFNCISKLVMSIIISLWATYSFPQDTFPQDNLTNNIAENENKTSEANQENTVENAEGNETENTKEKNEENKDEKTKISTRVSATTILEQQRIKLEQSYPQEQVIELSVLDDQFLSLWKEETRGQPLGTVLIIHGEGQTASWPHTIGALRQDLPLRGWSTLSISLEDPANQSIPERQTLDQITQGNSSENSSEKKPEDSNEDSPENMTMKENSNDEMNNKNEGDINEGDLNDKSLNEQGLNDENLKEKPNNDNLMKKTLDLEEKSIARINAAVKHLQSQGQYNIVIAAHGFAVQRALQYIEQTGTDRPESTQANQNIINNSDIELERNIRAMIFLNARNRLRKEQTSITSMFNLGDMPIMDIYFNLHFLDEADGIERKREAKNKQLKNYFQQRLIAPSTTVFDKENRVTRRIRGFLKNYAQGVKL